MKLVSKIILIFGIFLLGLSAAHSGLRDNSHPTTFLGPTIKGSFISPLTNTTAFSILGEAGVKNVRAGGTVGLMVRSNQRAKASFDLLAQRIEYPFFGGNTEQWVTQGSLSADYQYDLMGYFGNPQFDVSAFVSHAPNKSLSTLTGTIVRSGVTQTFVNSRRIAGSNAAGISPGVTLQPWMGGTTGAQLNYDNVRYDTIYVRNHDAKGFGGTVFLTQAVANMVNVNLLAAVRQPFNNYVASVDWVNIPGYKNLVLGMEGAYTQGKNTLPSTYNASMTVDFYMERNVTSPGPNKRVAQDFLAWTGTPAVYLPQVLAIPDERVTITSSCPFGVPTFIGPIPDQIPLVGVTTLDIKPFFTGNNLTYALNTITPPAFPGDSVTLNPATGILTMTNASPTFPDVSVFSITASNQCGTVTSNTFTITFFGIG